MDVEWINLIEAKHPPLYRVLLAAMTDSDKSYLAYMAARLLEMRRVLKPAGSIYLHCDPTMSHYLKLVMDAIFGRAAFRNEVVWERTTGRKAGRQYGRAHDVILFYGDPQGAVWNAPTTPQTEETVRAHDLLRGNGGLYRLSDFSGAGDGPPRLFDGQELHPPAGRHWLFDQENIDRLMGEGRVAFSRNGRPRLKSYVKDLPGTVVRDIWTDVRPINAAARERVGYPTQKPLALLRRIIAASGDPGDVVFDPFCGCATALIATEELQREWIGIDISEKAAELIQLRMRAELGLFHDGVHRTDVPLRTDLGGLPPYRTHKPALYGLQEGHCAGCRAHFEARHLEVDHIISRSNGGTDHVGNLQLLCGSCNRIKGNRGMDYLKAKLQF